MAGDANRLLALAEAIADGSPVDWAAEESCIGADGVALVRQLRLLAGVADVHRSATLEDTSTADRDVPDLSGSMWGSLQIRELVGAGSFGAVYRAHDPRLARDVALKLLRSAAGPNAAHAIVEEGRLLARVRHPHVVTVHGADQIEGQVGIWMEFVRGRTLEQVLQQDGVFGGREAALIGVDLCGALAAVHAQGLVHRDVKAQNVMREEGGRIVLMDFGAGGEAATVRDRRLTGTPVYMAPELFAGSPSTPRSDVYSLGVLLFKLVTGDYPVAGRTADEVEAAHARGERKRLRDVRQGLPGALVDAIERAMAVDPADRFDSAGAMQAALEQAIRPAAGDAPRAAGWPVPRRAAVAGLAVLAVAAVAALLWNRATPASSTPAAHGIRSLAVRPLANLTGDPAQSYFAAGLTDVLLAHFGSVRALRVVEVPDAAVDSIERLGVDGVFEGSVQRSNGRLRVSTRLVQAGTGAIVWGRTYEGPDADAFNLQSRIAADLTREVGVTLPPGESPQLGRTYDLSPEAQDAYLRGRYLLDSLSRPNVEQARVEFERAVQLEPTFAPAHAGLAHTYLVLGNVGALSPQEVRQLAPAAATTAFNLDPNLAEAALALADVRFRLEWDWEAAGGSYRRAVELNPSYMEGRAQYARFLAATGDVQAALREAQNAYRIDPLSAETHNVVGIMLYYNRRYDDAIAHYTARDDRNSARGHIGLGRALAAARRFPEAIAELNRAYELSGKDPSMYAELARTTAESGDVGGARVMLQELYVERRAGRGYVAPQDLAYVHIALREPDEAFALLNQAIAEQASRLLWLGVDPRVDAIRSDARFAGLLTRLGRPQ